MKKFFTLSFLASRFRLIRINGRLSEAGIIKNRKEKVVTFSFRWRRRFRWPNTKTPPQRNTPVNQHTRPFHFFVASLLGFQSVFSLNAF